LARHDDHICGDIDAGNESIRDARNREAERLAVTESDLKHVVRRSEREYFQRLKIQRRGLGSHYAGQNASKNSAGATRLPSDKFRTTHGTSPLPVN